MTHQIDSRLPGFQYDYFPKNVYRILADVYKDGDIYVANSLNLVGCSGEDITSLFALASLRKSAIKIIQSALQSKTPIEWCSDEEIQKNYENKKGNRTTQFITVLDPNELMEYYSQFGVISCIGELDALNQEYQIGYNYLSPNVKLEDIPTVYCGCNMEILEIGEITALNNT